MKNKLMAAAMMGAFAGLSYSGGGAPWQRYEKPGTRWPHPTKKRLKHADRIKKYKAQRAANRQRRIVEARNGQ